MSDFIEKLGISPEWTPSEASAVNKGILANVCGHGLENLLIADVEGYFVFQKKVDRDLCLAAPEMLKALIMQADLIANANKMDLTSGIISDVNHAVFDAVKHATGKTWEEIEQIKESL